MIATRLSSVWQVAGVAGAALCCYLASQSVAAERAQLAKVDRQIAQERDAIAKLTTEITTRGRLTQVESWNRQLALQAPRPGQYVSNGVQLASLYAHDSRPQLPLDPAAAPNQGAVQMAAYASTPPPAPASAPQHVPAVSAPQPAPVPLAHGPVVSVAYHAPVRAAASKPAPEAAPAQPLLRTATYVRPKSSRLDDAATPPIEHVGLPRSPASLLSSDIASLAKAEQATHASGKPSE